MRLSRILGVVAAGAIALSLGGSPSGASVMQPSQQGISQVGSNTNSTTQKAESSAMTYQKNVNSPFSFLSVGSNDGSVKQYNNADTKATSRNENDTQQQLQQDQSVSQHETHSSWHQRPPIKHPKQGCDERDSGYPKHHQQPEDGNRNVSQSGSNSNSTDQSASSSAKTDQTNVNAPISVFSVDSNNGDVHQGNEANTSAQSSNDNSTGQNLQQQQDASGRKSFDGKDGHDHYRQSQDGNGSGDVSQSGSNSNSTDQSAQSQAKTKQFNLNAPISLFSLGANNGHVQQGNAANTQAGSSNSNGTSQVLGQSQGVGSLLG